ncbi:hypothetical protein A1O3_08370 [Capronia epimyces CBS 606.96]|uniref:Uncharacterized protein n=1 Tax=Capronia epimyces CBS 606.96 TaxID=1182542 RepID=W9YCM2_9EURO|nr:uncharacterized protein A1O3_08370 [Capronia epimyces CBS 606.96]EXJ80084.1 hypothetical protein A1O3_08370 [Capronia epimyces CBS 606.96]
MTISALQVSQQTLAERPPPQRGGSREAREWSFFDFVDPTSWNKLDNRDRLVWHLVPNVTLTNYSPAQQAHITNRLPTISRVCGQFSSRGIGLCLQHSYRGAESHTKYQYWGCEGRPADFAKSQFVDQAFCMYSR